MNKLVASVAAGRTRPSCIASSSRTGGGLSLVPSKLLHDHESLPFRALRVSPLPSPSSVATVTTSDACRLWAARYVSAWPWLWATLVNTFGSPSARCPSGTRSRLTLQGPVAAPIRLPAGVGGHHDCPAGPVAVCRTAQTPPLTRPLPVWRHTSSQ